MARWLFLYIEFSLSKIFFPILKNFYNFPLTISMWHYIVHFMLHGNINQSCTSHQPDVQPAFNWRYIMTQFMTQSMTQQPQELSATELALVVGGAGLQLGRGAKDEGIQSQRPPSSTRPTA
jgi:hypothetical protein